MREAQYLETLRGAPGIITLHTTAITGRSISLVLEDIGGAALNLVFPPGCRDLDSFFPIAEKLIDALGAVHDLGIIHHDINPSNVICGSDCAELRIIDFDLASSWQEEARDEKGHEGTLGYIAPEQTGRMLRRADYRSDYYSLGATLFWLLSGRLPFIGETAGELIAQHLAKPAPRLDDLLPAIPRGLATVIDKLLQKEADRRYQSIQGIKADMEQCRAYAQRGVTDYDLAPGEKDRAMRLPLPYKLYGREEELHTIGGRLLETARRGRAVWAISGPAGVGKSRLAKTVAGGLLREGSLFCEGKFDQISRNVPYAGWSQAIGMLLQGLLTLPAGELEQWKSRLETALQGRGRVLYDLLPQLPLLVGEQPELAPVQGAEARNRFQFVFLEFLLCFATAEAPLAIFLDDLQWADDASLELLERALKEQQAKGLIFIGSWRDDEPAGKKPAEELFGLIKERGDEVTATRLAPLEKSAVAVMLSEMFGASPERIEPLAGLIHGKTAGNPLFTLEMLQSLFAEREILFDARQGAWRWDVAAISRRPLSFTAAELIVQRLKLLDQPALEALQYAACLSQPFSPADLAHVMEKSETAVRAILARGVVEGFLVPRDNLMLFSHDRIRQAVYTLLPDEKRSAIHLGVGRALVKSLPPSQMRERLLEITTQFNLGASLLQTGEERTQLAELNRQAETKARLNAAFAEAAHYIEKGMALLPAAAWETGYELAFALHCDRVRMLYLLGNASAAEREIVPLMHKARTVLDKVQLSRIRIAYHSVANNFTEAVDISLDALNGLGVAFPARPGEKDIETEWTALAAAMGKQGPAGLMERGFTNDPEHIALHELLVAAITPAYISHPPLFVLMAFRLMRLCFEQGVTTSSPVALIFYSAILANQNRIDEAYEAGLLSLRMLERTGAKNERPRVMFLFAATIAHWRRPMAAALPELREVERVGIEVGDVEFASYAVNQYHYQHIFMGQDLAAVLSDYAGMRDAMTRMRQKMTLDHFNLMEQFVLNLASPAGDPTVIKGPHIDEEEEERELIRTKNFFSLTAFYMFKAYLLYLFGAKEEAERKIAAALEYVPATTGMLHLPMEVFLQSLILGDRLEAEGASEEGLALLQANAERYRGWGERSAVNYKAKGLMAEAALMRAQQRGLEEILKRYEDAAAWAQECEQRFDQAIANEKAAEFLIGRGFHRLALPYLQQALFAYQLWGAAAKVDQLETRFKEPLREAAAQSRGTSKKRTSTPDHSLEHLDMSSILKASNAMSNIIVLEELLVAVLDIMVANAGAERGFLLLPFGGGWRIEASAGMDLPATRLEPPRPSEDAALLAANVVRYVARTGETVLLHNAATSAKFSGDKHIQDKGVRSLLCMPMVNRGETEAILYMENNIVSHAFTEEREELLKVLGAQAAISLRNATLFRDLAKKSASLEESEHFLRTLFEGTSAAVLLMDDNGVIDCNRAAVAMLGGGGKVSLAGKRLWDLSPRTQPSGEASVTLAARHLQVAREKGAHRFEWLVVNGKGDPFFADVLVTPIKYHERQLYHAIITDIDARTRFERKYRELNEERNYFTAVSAHELSTPITYLQSALALIEQEAESKQHAAPALGQIGKVVRESFIKLERIAGNTTLLSKLNSFDPASAGAPIALDGLLERVIQSVREKVRDHKRKVEIQSAAASSLAGLTVMGDWRFIERMFVEVLSNAVKYSPDGSEVRLQWEPAERSIAFRVIDKGVGFTAEEKDRLLRPYFSPFNIDHHHTSDYGFRGGGLGIGLVLAHRIAELHGGFLKIESMGKNQGATVTISLPLAPPQSAP